MLKSLTVWIAMNCGKFLKRWEYQTTLPISWEICMQVKKQRLEPDMEQWTCSKLGKEYKSFPVLSPCLFNLYAEHLMLNTRLDVSQAGIKIAKRNINNLGYADITTLMAESEEKLKSLLMRMKEKVKRLAWNSAFKNKDHVIQSHHFMANRWENNGNCDRLFSWAPKSPQKVTAAMKLKDVCSLEGKLWPT